MKYGIVIDSGCDLTGQSATRNQEIDFTRASLKLDIGDKEYIDSPDLDITSFMDEMYAYKGKTGSAAPSPDDYLNGFRKSENVFVITITSALSGSFASAKTAAELFKAEYPERNIYVIDSKSAGPEITLITYKLESLIKEGYSFHEICEKIDEYRKHTHLLFLLESLDNLVKNGRVSKLKASMAGILGIKMLGIATVEGTIDLLHKCRGKLSAYDKAVKEMKSMNYQGGKVVISHCFSQEMADYTVSKIKESFPACEVEVMPTSGLCSYYSEKGGMLIGFETL